jgi:hypothetical protein
MLRVARESIRNWIGPQNLGPLLKGVLSGDPEGNLPQPTAYRAGTEHLSVCHEILCAPVIAAKVSQGSLATWSARRSSHAMTM